MFQKNGTALYEQLVNKIEQEISSGKLAPGDRLPSENTLAEDNGISRVTVRQALKLLSEMGLIETQKGIGSFVSHDFDPAQADSKARDFRKRFEENFRQAIRAKIMIEPGIAKQAAESADDADIARLEEIWKRMDLKQSVREYDETCRQFHLALVALVGNPLLNAFYERLEELEQMYLRNFLLSAKQRRELREEDIRQHGEILFAIKERRPDRAWFCCQEHLEYFYHYYTDPERELE